MNPITIEEFKEWWRDNHPILLDTTEELPQYYEVFLRFFHILHRGGMEIASDIKPDKAKLMAITAAVKFAEAVEDLAGLNTLQILGKYIPYADDIITWIIAMIRPVTSVSDECRKDLKAEIEKQVDKIKASGKAPLLVDWMQKCLKSKDFLKIKEVALWFVNNHFVLSSYTEEPRYQMLDTFAPMYRNSMNESQQIAQSYVSFNWTFHINGTSSFTIPQIIKEWAEVHMSKQFEKLPLTKMEVLMPTLYKPGKNYKDGGKELINQQGKRYHVVFDMCDPLTQPDMVMQSMLVIYGGRAHFNGPSVWHKMYKWGTWNDEVMSQAISTPERRQNLYPRLAVKKPLQIIAYDFTPVDASKDYEAMLGCTFDYYNDNTPEALDGCLTIMENWAKKAEELLPSSSEHYRVFFITYGIIHLFPIYYVEYGMADYTRFNSRIRNLFTRLENAFVAGYLTGEGHNLRGMATKMLVKTFIDFNKHPFFKDYKLYNLNHLVKTLKKMK